MEKVKWEEWNKVVLWLGFKSLLKLLLGEFQLCDGFNDDNIDKFACYT